MENKETLFKTNVRTTLIQDEEYFKHIFKKTEKIACAVFFVTRSERDISSDDMVIRDVEDTSRRLLDVSLKALRATEGSRRIRLEDVGYMLMELESKLNVMVAAHLLPGDLLFVFAQEIDAVQRSMRKYTKDEAVNPLLDTFVERSTETAVRQRTKSPPERPRGESKEPRQMGGGTRRDRVLNVLRDTGEATIKDISERITDCSEKTIQRDLISLIKDGLIVREGERRWSKYKLV